MVVLKEEDRDAKKIRESVDSIIAEMQKRYRTMGREADFECHDTICRRVANRSRQVQEFAAQYEVIIFVSGEKSSNGMYLFDLCKKTNPRSYLLFHLQQLSEIPLQGVQSVGICGATSTPMWLMRQVADILESNF